MWRTSYRWLFRILLLQLTGILLRKWTYGVFGNVKVRLGGDKYLGEGLVQVYHERTWGWICYGQWNEKNADVVCRELGYTNASSSYSSPQSTVGKPTWIKNVQCQGTENSLLSCAHDGWKSQTCTNGGVAGVFCAVPEVRLVGGTRPFKGRVEIFFNGTWGTICHDHWELSEANVLCRQLGFERGLLALRNAAYGQGTGIIWMDNVNCTGKENAISMCKHKGWRVSGCGHSQDASVICAPKVRLVNDVVAGGGLVQVYHNKTWGWICDQQWDKNDADVVCSELGYTNALSPYSKSSNKNVGICMNNVRCVGNETSLFSCRHDGWKKHFCPSNKLAGVVCKTPGVRLVGGATTNQGRVEVFYDGAWGTICDDHWELPEANVVCRQLGFERALTALHSAAFGEGLDVIWMDGVNCTGNETAITHCKHKGWRTTDCTHKQDASVICKEKVSCPVPSEPTKVDKDAIYGSVIGVLALVFIVTMIFKAWKPWQRQNGDGLPMVHGEPISPQINEALEPEKSNDNNSVVFSRGPGTHMIPREIRLETREDAEPTQGNLEMSEYASLNPATRSGKLERENVIIEKIIGSGSFGQVAQGTATNLPALESFKYKDRDDDDQEHASFYASQHSGSCRPQSDDQELVTLQPSTSGSGRQQFKKGTPSDDELELLASELGNAWKKLGRRLYIKRPELENINQRNEELSEKGYQILMLWREGNGSSATYQILGEALQHELVNLRELAEKYCYEQQ